MFKILKTEGNARRGEFVTNRGTVQTPAFMNVATQSAIRLSGNALQYISFARKTKR